MFRFLFSSKRTCKPLAVLFLIGLSVALPLFSAAKKKKAAAPAPAAEAGPRKFTFDPKTLVWPSPPNIARISWVDYFAGAKIDFASQTSAKTKASWMDRLAGGKPECEQV